MGYSALLEDIGTKTSIPNWPKNDLEGLFDALSRWTLDPMNDLSGNDPGHPHAAFHAPFRCLAWGSCISEPIPGTNLTKYRYVGTKPIYPDHPEAVSYLGNFVGYSFGFHVVTDDVDLIAELDRRIAENMSTTAYQEAKARWNRNQREWGRGKPM